MTTPMPDDPRDVRQTPPLPPELLAAIKARIDETPARSRPRSRRLTIGLTALCAAVAAAVFFAYGGLRDDGGPRPAALIFATTLGSALIAGFALWIGAGQRSMLARPARVLWAAIVLIPLLLLGWKVGWSALFDGAMVEWPERIGIPCLQISLLSGIGPLVVLGWSVARGEPNRPALLGAVLGITAGAFAWVVTDLWCPVGHLPHLLLGHVLPLTLLGLLGAALGAWCLRIRWSGSNAA